ncbi:retrovirus-related Pol polyprotein from transposon TNT 1-94 [Cucumis melo var. makuwa]|uniref:Retrovirus-related Pol polyprotein from transposon TNT 1-94 n=1 Tax=Cucumis melo var. makuwa TaxID=1194695 RepID=A0A5A7TDH0_CUCMM|nr:retrovirus-related Pol polyprotein from transposon TNT 1-94 [Cucumis melo var. makuwa]
MRSLYDPCVYYKKLTDGSLIYLLLYVDDMLLAGKNLTKLNEIKEQLKNEFEMKDLGSAKRILGMEITRQRSRRELFLSQKQYTKKVLAKFNMANANEVSTSMGQQFKLSAKESSKESTERQAMSNVPYSNATGSLMYLMVCTRPDLAYNSSLFSRYMGNPGRNHWETTKWVFRYLVGTLNRGLLYAAPNEPKILLKGYVDADFAGDCDKRRSLINLFFLNFGRQLN